MPSTSTNSSRDAKQLVVARVSESTLQHITDIMPPPHSDLIHFSKGLLFPVSGAISMRLLTYLSNGTLSQSLLALPAESQTPIAKVDTSVQFTLFEKLPNEVKDLIWKYALLNEPPRVVRLSCQHNESWNQNKLPSMVALSDRHCREAFHIHGYVSARGGIHPTSRQSRNLCFRPGYDMIYLPRMSCVVCSAEVDWLKECPSLVQTKSVALRREMIFLDQVIQFLRSCVNLDAVFMVYETMAVCDTLPGLDPANKPTFQHLGCSHHSYYERAEKQKLRRFERKLSRAGGVVPYIFAVKEL